MQFGVVTLFPELINSISTAGVIGRGIQQNCFAVQCWNPRDYATDKHRTVDDRPYGGGPGMVMKPEPLSAAIQDARAALPGAKVIYLSPQGQRFTQSHAVDTAAATQPLILVCGRYEGIDERVIEAEVDQEWSIGDYVLSGGELPAMVVIEAIARLIPGVLGDAESAQQDSFMDGLLDCPHYTRPVDFAGREVPKVLLSGDHQAIRHWRAEQASARTQLRRPDLLT